MACSLGFLMMVAVSALVLPPDAVVDEPSQLLMVPAPTTDVPPPVAPKVEPEPPKRPPHLPNNRIGVEPFAWGSFGAHSGRTFRWHTDYYRRYRQLSLRRGL